MARIKTRKEVRAEFQRTGTTIRSWASKHGFNERIVYAVINGGNKGNYGEAHRAAVLLGLKEGVI